MRVLRCATVGVAVALGATAAQTGAFAQNVISRTIDNEPVETTVTRGPAGTVVTRRPLAAPAASESVRVGPAAYMDETVGVAPTTSTTTRTTTRARTVRPAHSAVRRVTHTRTVTRMGRRVGAQLVLGPAERQVIYRTIVQEQVIPQVAVPAPPPGYPAYPTPAYPARTVVVPAETTTGYAVTTPAETYYYNDDVYAERTAAGYPVRYTVGSRLPSDIALTPLPATAAVAVPAARPYSYATIDNRVLLVDPATDTVVADITP